MWVCGLMRFLVQEFAFAQIAFIIVPMAFWWFKAQKLQLWTFWDEGRWNLQASFEGGDFFPTWGGAPFVSNNGFTEYHITLPGAFRWNGQWEEGWHYDERIYQTTVGDVWLAMTRLKNKEGSEYFQFVLDKFYMEEVISDFIEMDLSWEPHVSVKVDKDF